MNSISILVFLALPAVVAAASAKVETIGGCKITKYDGTYYIKGKKNPGSLSGYKAETFEACLELCKEDDGCNAVNYAKSGGVCEFFETGMLTMKGANEGQDFLDGQPGLHALIDCPIATKEAPEVDGCKVTLYTPDLTYRHDNLVGQEGQGYGITEFDQCVRVCKERDDCKGVNFVDDNNCQPLGSNLASVSKPVKGKDYKLRKEGLHAVIDCPKLVIEANQEKILGCVVTKYPNTDYLHNNLLGAFGKGYKASSFEDCVKMCKNNDGCNAINFGDGMRCELLSAGMEKLEGSTKNEDYRVKEGDIHALLACAEVPVAVNREKVLGCDITKYSPAMYLRDNLLGAGRSYTIANYEQCIQACTENEKCVAVNFIGGKNCEILGTGIEALEHVAKGADKDYTTPDGAEHSYIVCPEKVTVEEETISGCQVKRYDGAYYPRDYMLGEGMGVTVSSFEDCVKQCWYRDGCNGVNYLEGGLCQPLTSGLPDLKTAVKHKDYQERAESEHGHVTCPERKPTLNVVQVLGCDILKYGDTFYQRDNLMGDPNQGFVAASFEECIEQCLIKVGCKAVNYDGRICMHLGSGVAKLEDAVKGKDYAFGENALNMVHAFISCPDPKPSDPVECGRSAKIYPQKLAKLTRIIGGSYASNHSWPWLVAFEIDKGNNQIALCGGTLVPINGNMVESDIVITAAHCLTTGDIATNPIPLEARQVTIIAGEHDRDRYDVGQQRKVAAEIFIHPAYKNPNNDIAIVLLASPVKFSDTVRPACLPEKNAKIPYEQTCAVAGWGRVSSTTEETSQILKQLAPFQVHDADTCTKNEFGGWGAKYVEKQMICAGPMEGNADTCQGDSGGMLVCRPGNNDPWTLFGATSFGVKGCLEKGKPGTYSRVSSYMDWVNAKIAKSSVK